MNTNIALRSHIACLMPAALLCFIITTSTNSRAAIVIEPNLFNGKAISVNNGPSNGSYSATNLIAGGDASKQFIFDDATNGTPYYMSISGFTTSLGIDTINVFDTPSNSPVRISPNVTIYYTSTALTGNDLLDPDNYISLGNFSLTFDSSTTGTVNQDFGGANVDYTTISVNIPIGTQSVLFSFAGNPNGSDDTYGPSFTQIQGFESIPEPSSIALALAGFVATFLAGRRDNCVS